MNNTITPCPECGIRLMYGEINNKAYLACDNCKIFFNTDLRTNPNLNNHLGK